MASFNKMLGKCRTVTDKGYDILTVIGSLIAITAKIKNYFIIMEYFHASS